MGTQGFLFSKRFFRIAAISWATLIFIISSIPFLPNPEIPTSFGIDFRLDYLFHFGVFFILGIAVVLWLIPKNLKFSGKILLTIILCGTVYGAIDEIHQLWIPGRRFNPNDLYYNLIGFWTGVGLTYFFLIRLLLVKQKRFPVAQQRLGNRS